jgi:gamma-glutamyltranspeptidase / glutathione hydrolase
LIIAVPRGCGFTLHNRGLNFSLDANHPNVFAGGKHPYHTIIPGLMTDVHTKKLVAVFGCMGSFMQPQGHVQIVSNLVDWNMNAQEALDAPRFRIRGTFAWADGEEREEIVLEEGAWDAAPGLADRYHTVVHGEGVFFGRGQVITVDQATGVVCAGSDGRADGNALSLVY